MQFAGLVGVAVMTIGALVEFLAVLQNIGSIVLGWAIADVPVHFGEHGVNLLGCKCRLPEDEDMGMKGLALITLFITHAPVERVTTDLGHDVDNTFMVKAVLQGIVDGHKPLAGLLCLQ